MMTADLINAMWYGGIWIFCMVGILGICMEMALRR